MITVMVVDDSIFMRNRLSELLTRNGYDTVLAEDGEQAVLNYRRTRPDVVLMDVTMPRKDGLQALTEIRQLDAGAKVIMLTTVDQELVLTRAIHLGARDFLVKPIPPARLIATLRGALQQNH